MALKRSSLRKPRHPGELFREIVFPGLGKSKTEIARLLGISRETLYKIIREEQPVTPDMAVRLGKLCGNGPRLWLNMQVEHDLWLAERRVDTSAIPTLKADAA
jgi:antitoxin HigA-1